MRVCKHGFDVKMFCFSRANHASTHLKKFSSSKLDKFYSIYPFLRRLKLGKSLQRRCVNFFSLKLIFYARKNRILESIVFAKQRLITRTSFVYNTLRLVRIFLLIKVLNKGVLLFFWGELFYKSNRKRFSAFAYPDINTRGVGRILDSYANPRLRLGFA